MADHPVEQSCAAEGQHRYVTTFTSYRPTKKFFDEFTAFPTSVFGNQNTAHSRSFEFQCDNGETLMWTCIYQAQGDKRAKDRPLPTNEGHVPRESNEKIQAYQALQKPACKRAFAEAFPAEQHGLIVVHLKSMLIEHMGIAHKRRGDVVKALERTKPWTKAESKDVEHLLSALWSCVPYVDDKLNAAHTTYETKRAHFEQIRLALQSDPPQLSKLAAFNELKRRVMASGAVIDGAPVTGEGSAPETEDDCAHAPEGGGAPETEDDCAHAPEGGGAQGRGDGAAEAPPAKMARLLSTV